jgi:hypothetical protein
LTELLQVQVICTRKICTTRKLDGQSGITECIENVRDDVLFRDANTEDLTFAIDSHDTTRSFVIGSDKDGFARNAVHINANAGFEIVEMNEPVFSDEEDDAVTRGNLHCNGEIVCRFRREENVYRFLLERRIIGIMIDLDDVQLSKLVKSHLGDVYLCTGGIPDGKSKEFGLGRSTLQLKFRKCGGVTFNRLTNTPIPRIKLHIPNDPTGLLRDTNQSHPFILTVDFVTDNLSPLQRSISFKDFLRTRRIRVNRPVKNRSLCDKTDCFLVNPFPVCDVFVHDVRFEFGFQLEIEDLKLSLRFESNDFLTWMHDCAVGCDGSTHDGSIVVEVNDDYIVCVVDFFANATECKSD